MIFDKPKFPILKIQEDYFEVKAVDHWEPRKFNYNEVTSIEYYNPNDKWWNNLTLFGWSPYELMFRELEPSILKINKTNGGDWKYTCPNKKDIELMDFINLIRNRINN